MAIAQRVLLHLGAVHIQSVAVAAVFQPVTGIANDDRGQRRECAVGKLQVVVAFAAAANQKRRLSDNEALAGMSGATTSIIASDCGEDPVMPFNQRGQIVTCRIEKA